MNWIIENITWIMTVVAVPLFTGVATNIVKTLKQNKLNKAFDRFKSNIDVFQDKVNNESDRLLNFAESVENIAKDINQVKNEVVKEINQFREEMEVFKQLFKDDILSRLDEKLNDIHQIALAIDMKDQTISKYAEDLKEIKTSIERSENEQKL